MGMDGITLDPMEAKVFPLRINPLKGKNYSEIVFMGDFHLGSGNFSLSQYMQYVKYVLAHPEVKVGLMGDLIEMGSLSPYGASEEKVGSIQLVDIVELLRPIKERIFMLLEGNHEERFWRSVKGTDSISRSIADALRIKPFLPGPERGQLFVVESGKYKYPVYAIHGSTGSTVQRATQLGKIYANIKTSLVVHGHIHQIFKDHRTFYEVNEDEGKYFLTVQEQHWLTTGCFVKNLGYAEKSSMGVTKIGAPIVRFYTDKHAIEVVDDPRVTYGIGSYKFRPREIGLEDLSLVKYTERQGFGGTEVISRPTETLNPAKEKLNEKKATKTVNPEGE